MVKRASVKDLLREIRKTFSRFVSIILLLILSVSFFSGLRVTKPDMQKTADDYMDQYDMYDLRVQATLGLTDGDLDAIQALGGVAKVSGFEQFDALAEAPEQDIVISVLTLNGSGMDMPEVLSGRLPTAPDECVAEDRFLSTMKLSVGDTFSLKEVTSAFEDALSGRTFKIVGMVRSPLYISKVQRGSSALGNGSVYAYIMVPDSAVSLDYYTGADISVAGAREETAYTDAYKNTVKAVSERLDKLSETQAPARHDDVVSKANDELEKSKTELNDKKAELQDAANQLNDAKAALADGQKKLDDEKASAAGELQKAWDKLVKSDRDIQDGYQALEASQKSLDAQKADGESRLQAAESGLNDKKAQLAAAFASYNDARTRFQQQLSDWNALPDSVKATMPDKAAELSAAQQQLDAQKQQLDAQQTALDAGFNDLDAQKAALAQLVADGQRKIDAGRASLKASQTQLKAGYKEYDRQKAEADKKLANAESDLKDARAKIADNEAKLADGQAQIEEAESDIKDAEAKLADIPENTWYMSDRTANAGYNSYGQDADRMGALGNIFPAIFFAVAALVCLTTMTRMVDDKRIEIGTYKALGYSRRTTAGKFIDYSLLATVAGVAGGLLVGSYIFPRVIFKAYSILYNLPPLLTPLQPNVIVISAAAALLCTVGATVYASYSTLRETPASLLRPKAPEPGKRVLLEYITPLWKRMSFFAKVSARNIFRYKKRLVMTLLGIAGCTALIVTGFGLRDSITDITDKQFGQVLKYDLQVYMTEGAGEKTIGNALRNNTAVSDDMFARYTSADFTADSGIESGYVIVPEDPGRINDFIGLNHMSDGKKITLTDDGAVITEKLAELLGLRIGDTLTIEHDGRYAVRVADIAENYVYHYVYMTPAYYTSVFGKNEPANQALVKLKDTSDATADSVSSDLLKLSDVSYVNHFRTVARTFRDSMNSVNYVVLIILVSAALLALVVLYNLTNINITERSRELATIKVLGFYDREVSSYIFRENTILTAVGIAVGLVGGKFLHGWLVRTVELDFVMFSRQAKPLSYLYAALLTALFAVLVNFIGHRHMKRINMVESLKTNE